MIYLADLLSLEFWSEDNLKNGLETIMYIYNAAFVLFNSLIVFVSLFISFRVLSATERTLSFLSDQSIQANKQIKLTEQQGSLASQQFLTSIKPEIVIKEKNFILIYEKPKGFKYSFPVKHKDIFSKEQVNEFNYEDSFELELLNIGLGPAKDIIIELDYDLKSMRDSFIKNRAKYLQFYEEIRALDPGIYNQFRITHPVFWKSVDIDFTRDYIFKYTFKYLMNSSENENLISINLDRTFWQLFLFINFFEKNQDFHSFTEMASFSFFSLKMKINYKDISNGINNKYYKIIYWPINFVGTNTQTSIKVFETDESFQVSTTSPTNLSQTT